MDSISLTILLLLSGLISGFIFIYRKKMTLASMTESAESTAPALSLFLSTAIMSSLISLPLILGLKFHWPSTNTWILSVVSAAIYALSQVLGYKAYETADASSVGLIHRLSLVGSALLGIWFLHEQYVLTSWIGLGCIVVSILLLGIDGTKWKFSVGERWAVLMALTSSIAAVMDKVILHDMNAFAYVFINSILTVIVCAARPKIFIQVKKLYQTQFRLILITSLLAVGSWIFFLVALQAGDISKVIPIYKGLGVVVPVLLGILWLKEYDRWWQKLIAVGLSVVGMILLIK